MTPPRHDRARLYLRKCPLAISGQGGHRAAFRVACAVVRGFELDEAEALAVLQEWNRGCQPPWSEAELRHKIQSAKTAQATKPDGYLARSNRKPFAGRRRKLRSLPTGKASPEKPVFQPAILQQIAVKLPQVDFEYVRARSPKCPETQTPVTFLQHLFRRGEWVVVFDDLKSQGLFACQWGEPPYDTAGLNHLIHGCPDGVWYLCNPVDGEFHPNPRLGGKRSRRSEESVTAWRYMVLESDEANAQHWLAALVQMPLRIAAIYTSGGRSIHVLVRVDAPSKADWDTKARELKPLLTILGADPAAMTAVRLTRLPGCYRGEQGPPAPKRPPLRKRWVDEPLKYDANGDPIWTPDEPRVQPINHWVGGKLQELLYLNSEPALQPICQMPTRDEIHQQWTTEKRRHNRGCCE